MDILNSNMNMNLKSLSENCLEGMLVGFPDYYVYAMAIKNCIGGVSGFLASIIGSKILEYIQASGNVFMSIPMYGQQLLSAISLVIIVIDILFIHFVVEKQKVMIQ